MVMVSFFPKGKIVAVAAKNYCACENCIVGNFDHCYEDVCDSAIYDGKKDVVERMVWDGVSVFSVEVHRLEVCAVGHIPRLVLP